MRTPPHHAGSFVNHALAQLLVHLLYVLLRLVRQLPDILKISQFLQVLADVAEERSSLHLFDAVVFKLNNTVKGVKHQIELALVHIGRVDHSAILTDLGARRQQLRSQYSLAFLLAVQQHEREV